MARGYYCTSLTGGGAGSLDGITAGSTTGYEHGSIALVNSGGNLYIHIYDSTITAASERSPITIIPDDNTSGIGAWVLVSNDWSIDNDGAVGEETTTLPAGADGMKFRARVTVAQYLKIVASGTNTFRFGATQGAAGGYIRSNVIGNVIEGEWHGEWLITNIIGSWNYDA